MKASELRIGNWVEQPNDGITRVNAILNNLQIRTETGYVDKYCKPIPLTEEWLVRFGFEKDDGVTWYNQIALYEGNKCFNYNASYFEHHNLISIEHVHQLQNLYFALTNEELILEYENTTNKQ